MVPMSDICPKFKRWRMKEIRELRTRFRKLGRKVGRYKGQPEHILHMEYKESRKQYERAIKYNKHHHWRDWLEKASEPDLWMANKYITAPVSDRGKTTIPVLWQQSARIERTANLNQDKSIMLAGTLFPKKLVNTVVEAEKNEYLPPACKAHKILKEQVRRQLKWLKPYKAPGPDGIPNIVLMQCADLLIDSVMN